MKKEATRERVSKILYDEHEDTELEFHEERVNNIIDLMLEMVGEDDEWNDTVSEQFADYKEHLLAVNNTKKAIRERILESVRL